MVAVLSWEDDSATYVEECSGPFIFERNGRELTGLGSCARNEEVFQVRFLGKVNNEEPVGTFTISYGLYEQELYTAGDKDGLTITFVIELENLPYGASLWALIMDELEVN